MKREEIIASIYEISEALKRPIPSNAERMMLHEDRKELRRRLEEYDISTKGLGE